MGDFKWMTFRDGKRGSEVGENYLSVYFDKEQVYFNAKLNRTLGSKYVGVGYDEEERKLAFLPLEEGELDGSNYVTLNRGRAGSPRLVRKIAEMLGSPDRADKGKFKAEFEGDILVVDLNNELGVGSDED